MQGMYGEAAKLPAMLLLFSRLAMELGSVGPGLSTAPSWGSWTVRTPCKHTVIGLRLQYSPVAELYIMREDCILHVTLHITYNVQGTLSSLRCPSLQLH